MKTCNLTELDRELQIELAFPENAYLTEAEKAELLATPRADALSDAIAALQFARVQAIDMGVRARQCETNLSVALELLQQLAARR